MEDCILLLKGQFNSLYSLSIYSNTLAIPICQYDFFQIPDQQVLFKKRKKITAGLFSVLNE